MKLDIEKFLDDAETCCFDCGSSQMDLAVAGMSKLIKIHRGVSLCSYCHAIATQDYPLLKGEVIE